LLVASVDPEHFDLRSFLSGWYRFDFNVRIRLNDRLLEVVCWSSEASSSTILNDNFAHFRETIKKFIKEHILSLLINFYSSNTNNIFALQNFLKVLSLSNKRTKIDEGDRLGFGINCQTGCIIRSQCSSWVNLGLIFCKPTFMSVY
jgi:hypothetical protein